MSNSPSVDRWCASVGHPPYVNAGHGGNESVTGCYCGHIRCLPIWPRIRDPMGWHEVPGAKFIHQEDGE